MNENRLEHKELGVCAVCREPYEVEELKEEFNGKPTGVCRKCWLLNEWKKEQEACRRLSVALVPLLIDFELRTIDPKPNKWKQMLEDLRLVLDNMTRTKFPVCAYCLRPGTSAEDLADHTMRCARSPLVQLIKQIGKVSGEAMEIVEFINELRAPAGSGNSVILCCDNDEPPPGVAVDCSGDWTLGPDPDKASGKTLFIFGEERFESDTLLECLQKAVAKKREREGVKAVLPPSGGPTATPPANN